MIRLSRRSGNPESFPSLATVWMVFSAPSPCPAAPSALNRPLMPRAFSLSPRHSRRAGIQNPDHAPRRLCQLRRAGCTGRRRPWTIPADPHQVGWEKGLWIPAAARMTDSLVKATREDENCLFIVIADGLARPRMRMKLAYFHNNDGAGGTAESYEVATHRFSLFWKYPSRTASAAIQLRLTTGHKHPGETGGPLRYTAPGNTAPVVRRGATSSPNRRMDVLNCSFGTWPPTLGIMMTPDRPSSSITSCRRRMTTSGVP